jgi:hypothetical protein
MQKMQKSFSLVKGKASKEKYRPKFKKKVKDKGLCIKSWWKKTEEEIY